MDSKLPIYHWLVVLIPGSAFLAATYFLFGYFSVPYFAVAIPGETIKAFVFLTIALITGELIQAVGSIIEPFIFWTWGGMPSKAILTNSKYKGAVKELRDVFGADHSDDDLFRKAMAVCNRGLLGRTEYFNTLYAYTRSLLSCTLVLFILTIFFIFSTQHGGAGAWLLLFFEFVLTLIFWHRAKQRGVHFAREVISQAALSAKA